MLNRISGWATVACVLGLVGLGGCSAESDPGEDRAGGLEPIAEDGLPAALAEATCRGLSACCANREFAFDEAACLANLSGFWEYSLRESSETVHYDAEAAARCAQASDERAAACEYPDSRVEPCNRILVGTLPLGAPCQRWDECASTADGEAQCELLAGGVCINAVRGQVGDPCYETATQEGVNTITTGPGGSGTGVEENYTRIRCWTNDGLHCFSENDPVCQPLVEIGGECELLNVLGTARCVDEAYCDTLQNVCVARVSLGGACEAGLHTDCATDTYCSEAGTCEVMQPDGATCGSFGSGCIGVCNIPSVTCTGAFAEGYFSAEACAGSVMPEFWN